jgi:hypothetical protein
VLPLDSGQADALLDVPGLVHDQHRVGVTESFHRDFAHIIGQQSTRSEDLFAGWWQLIETLGAVPRVLVWDGKGAVGRWRGGRSELTTAGGREPGAAGPDSSALGERGDVVLQCDPVIPSRRVWLIRRTRFWAAER